MSRFRCPECDQLIIHEEPCFTPNGTMVCEVCVTAYVYEEEYECEDIE